jgi:DNA-binding LacI/PurR family transcriptional regulator
VDEWLQPGDWEIEGGYQAAQALLRLANRPSAIFAANDLMALGAIYAIQDAGLSVPHDMAVVGYDNRDFTWIVRPRITTVVMPVYEMGKVASEMLLKQISGETGAVEEVKIKGELIIRDTCGADDSMKTKENANHTTSPRRVLIHGQPED